MITIYFAPPGVGKSTLAARFAMLEHIRSKLGISRYDRVYCNFPCKYTYQFDIDDYGKFNTGGSDKGSLILIDEIGICHNNRDWKSLSKETRDHYKLHRHYKEADIIGFSQSYEDMDTTVRRLCTRMYLLRKCTILPYHVKALRITKQVTIDDERHEIVDGYSFDPWWLRWLTTKRYYLPFYWHMFDSWSCPQLPDKEFLYHE